MNDQKVKKSSSREGAGRGLAPAIWVGTLVAAVVLVLLLLLNGA